MSSVWCRRHSEFSSRLAAEANRLCTESRGCLPTATLLGSPSRSALFGCRLPSRISRGVNYPRSRGALLSVLLFLRSSSSSAEKSVAATERGARPRADLVALSLSFSTLDACKNQKSAPQATVCVVPGIADFHTVALLVRYTAPIQSTEEPRYSTDPFFFIVYYVVDANRNSLARRHGTCTQYT